MGKEVSPSKYCPLQKWSGQNLERFNVLDLQRALTNISSALFMENPGEQRMEYVYQTIILQFDIEWSLESRATLNSLNTYSTVILL